MQVLGVLFGSLLLYRGLGTAGVSLFASWIVSARFALATMFVFTAVSHFAPMKKDLIAMVPPNLPRPVERERPCASAAHRCGWTSSRSAESPRRCTHTEES